jgi:glycolate oxidase FAD binding subunit
LPTVSEPQSLQEAAELMRGATSAGARVSIERDGGDVVVSTRGLGRLLEHEPGDLTCIVEAGMRLSELQAALRPKGQMLMLDPPGDPTIGACIAGNLSGPRSHRYGGPRDLVLGLTVVLSDGTVASSGGRVVKNVAGYDLGKLFCGSRGRLGLIARVALRLHATPAATATAGVALDDPGEAQRLARLATSSQLALSALDVDWPGRLLLRVDGSERVVASQLAAACDLLGCEQLADDAAWASLSEKQAAAAGRASFAPGELASFLATTPAAVVRVAAGHAYVPTPHERPWSPLAERVRAELDPARVLA